MPENSSSNWFARSLNAARNTRSLGSRPIRRKHARRLSIDSLEDRSVPAALVFVDDSWVGTTLGADPDGAGPATAFGTDSFATIQAGVNAVDAGGTIKVHSGVYNEFISVNKTLTIQGEQAGVDARTGRVGAAESIVQANGSGQAGFNLAADNIVLDGFTIQNSTNGAFPGFGVLMGAGKSGAQVLNNIIQNNIAGISLANTGATQARIQFNLIRNNNQAGPASGHGIYTDQFNAGGTVANVLIDSNTFAGNVGANADDIGQGVGFSSTDPAHPATAITISNNLFDANDRGLYAFNLTNSSITGNTFQNSTDATTADIRLFEGVNGLTISKNVMQDGAGRAVRISNAGTGAANAANIAFTLNSVTGYASPDGAFVVDAGQYTGSLNATGNWWGNITGPTTANNPGGSGQIVSDPDALVDFQPWLVYSPDSDSATAGVQFASTVSVPAQTTGFTATNNNYRRLVNVVDLLQDGQTVVLSGTFDWTEANAANAWSLGNDGVAGTGDDFSLVVPASVSGVTLTAASLGSARILGPGDLAAVNLEGFLVFDGGDNQNWTISNLEIFDFDLGIGMFSGAGGTDAFNNLTIQNNHIRVPADLNATVAPADVNQNIAIHYSFGTNETIRNNQIDLVGTGVSAGANLSSSVGMQSNTGAGGVYNGLLIDGNILRVLGAQSASPARILGIWENGHAHGSNITISNNQFLNTGAGNNSALNLQRAFRITSHSTATSTVTYTGNTVDGANIGFEWFNGADFTGNQAVRLAQNTILNSDTGVLIQSNGIANLFQNTIRHSGSGGGVHVVTGSLAATGAVTHAVEQNFITGGTGDGIRIEASAGSIGSIFNNDLSIGGVVMSQGGRSIRNLSGSLIDASANYWTLTWQVDLVVSANVDYGPWLIQPDSSVEPGFQGNFDDLVVAAKSPQVGAVGRISEGVALINPGGDLFVMDGTYTESVTVNKPVWIDGGNYITSYPTGGTPGGPFVSVVEATGGNGFTINAPNVTIANFTVTPGVGSAFGIAEAGPLVGTRIEQNTIHGFSNSLAVVIGAGSSGFSVSGNEIFNNYAGVYLSNNASDGTVSGNLIRDHNGSSFTDDGSGVVLEGGNPNVTITGNEITGNRQGIFVWSGFGSDLSGTHVTNNSIAGNTAGVVNTNAAVLDASGNWWGTNTAAGVATAAGAGVDFTPWLDAGTDSDTTTTFAGSFAALDVGTGGPQTGTTGRIQEGVDLVNAGGTVNVHSGTYAENVNVNKSLTIAGILDTLVAPTISPASGTGLAFTAAGSVVTIQDLKITGATTAVTADGLSSLTLSGLNLTGNGMGGVLHDVTTINWFARPGILLQGTGTHITVTPTQIVEQGKDAISYSGTATLNVKSGFGDDTIVVTPSVDTAINVDGESDDLLGGDTLIVNQNGLGATITPTQVLIGGGRKPVGYVNIESVTAPAAVLIGGDLLIGGTNANDVVAVTLNAARTNLIVSLNGKVVGTFLLSDVTGRIVVRTNEGNDVVQIGSVVPVDAEVHGEAGNDRLFGGRGHDYLDGGAGNDSAVGGDGNDTLVGGDGRDTLVGSAGTDTIVGPDAIALWRIGGVGAGAINTTTSFKQVEGLSGGTGADTFRFVGNGAVAGKIDGGVGDNTLDYSFIATGVRANLFANTATRTGGVTNIENVIGGAGRDILVGDAQSNRLVGNGGRDILIGGGGSDMLFGRAGDDILVAGSTDHDGSAAALNSLMNEWKRPIAYSARVRHLNRTLAGGLNGANELTVATVHDDGGSLDSMTGGLGTDWFITFAGDATDAAGTETVTAL